MLACCSISSSQYQQQHLFDLIPPLLILLLLVPPCQVSEADSKRDVSDAISLKWKKRRPRKQEDEKEEALSKKGNSKRMSLLKRPFSQNIET